MAFENPEFASPTEHPEVTINYDQKTVTISLKTDRTPSEARLRFEQYEWFVSLLLNACEEMLNVIRYEDEHIKDEDKRADDDSEDAEKAYKDRWLAALTTQIGFHYKYLESLGGKTYLERHFPPEFVKFALAACAKARSTD